MEKLFIKTFIFVLALGLVSSAMAQESGFPTEEAQRPSESQPQQEEEWNVREGGMLIQEREVVVPSEHNIDSSTPVLSNNRNALPLKDNSRINNPDLSEGHNNAVLKDGEDESVLSFNFLYYLIQKFKFDTVE